MSKSEMLKTKIQDDLLSSSVFCDQSPFLLTARLLVS